MNEMDDIEYECRNDDGTINPLTLEEWQVNMDDNIVILCMSVFD